MTLYALISLPEDVFVVLVTHWLQLGEIVRLDSAVCSKCARSNYLDTLSKITQICTSARLQQVPTEIYFEWMMLRGISLRALEAYTFDGREKNTFVAQHLSRLSNLVLNRSSLQEWIWLEGLLPHCSKLLTVEIRGNRYLNKHMTLLSQWCPNLQNLCVVGDLSDPFLHGYPANEALDTLISTHPALSRIIIIHIPVRLSVIENCGASGKVVVFAGPFFAHSTSYPGDQLFQISLVRTEGGWYSTQPVHYFNCSFDHCLHLLHDHLRDGELLALTFNYSALLELFLLKFTSMIRLRLTDCTRLTEQKMCVLLSAPHLEWLQLRSNHSIQSVEFSPQNAVNTSLQSLSLEKFTSFQTEGVRNIVQNCVNLRFVAILEMPHIDRNWLSSCRQTALVI